MTSAAARRVVHVWERRGVTARVLWSLLWPWSLVYRLLMGLRNLLYRVRVLRGRKLPLPVVSVGSLTVGGAGKTPTALWLARALGRRGLETTILTRGYGGAGTPGLAPLIDPEDARRWLDENPGRLLLYGDEPAMMSALYGQSVGVGTDRHRVGLELSREPGGMNLFVLDDGFQHRRLHRDLDVVLLDREGFLLPAGPFREPVRALRRADVVLVTGAHEHWRRWLERRFDRSRVFFGNRAPRAVLVRTDQGHQELTLGALAGTPVLAVAAIADPAPFYAMLRECEATIVETMEYPDHHAYSEKDWRDINRRPVEKIITTEKDYVKLARFPFSTGRLLALRMEMTVDRPEELLDCVVAAVRHGASSE